MIETEPQTFLTLDSTTHLAERVPSRSLLPSLRGARRRGLLHPRILARWAYWCVGSASRCVRVCAPDACTGAWPHRTTRAQLTDPSLGNMEDGRRSAVRQARSPKYAWLEPRTEPFFLAPRVSCVRDALKYASKLLYDCHPVSTFPSDAVGSACVARTSPRITHLPTRRPLYSCCGKCSDQTSYGKHFTKTPRLWHRDGQSLFIHLNCR